MNNKPATEISPQKLFDVLQKEYIVCIIRSKIYPIEKHKKYWSDLAERKKLKIINLKTKYNLYSIFDDVMIYKSVHDKIINEFGLPNFYYSNESFKDKQIYWDIKNWFTLESNCKFFDSNGKEQKGLIKKVDVERKLIHINYSNTLLEWVEIDAIGLVNYILYQ